jgi:hypothetical protein
MFIYLALFFLAATGAYVATVRNHSKALAIFFAIVLIVFAGTRDEVGCDFLAYKARFDYLYIGVDWLQGFEMGEGGFNLLNILARDLDFTFAAVTLVSAFVYIACLLRYSMLASTPMSVLVVAYPILVLQLGMSGMRQALATGFLCMAWVAFVGKKKWQVALWIVVASQFHTSAVIFLPLALLAGRKVSAIRLFWATVFLAPVVGWMLGDRIDVYQDRYVDEIYGENSSGGAWIRYAMALVPFLILEWKRKLVESAFPDQYPLMRLFSLMPSRWSPPAWSTRWRCTG